MFTKTFFKLFPPPKFLNVPHAGLDISDDAIRCVGYHETIHGLAISTHGIQRLEPGIIEGGYIKKEEELIQALRKLSKDTKVINVRVSLPEERMYLFRTEVPTRDYDEIRQNIESQLEENVPLPASEALFFFSLVPQSLSKGKNLVSVSVAPKELVNSYLRVLESAGFTVFAFEGQPRAIARAVVANDSVETLMLIHAMETKTGIYIVSGGVVCFTSTIQGQDTISLKHEIGRVLEYWNEYGQGGVISKIIISGKTGLALSKDTSLSPDPALPVEPAHIWTNAFSNEHYISPIVFEDSLEYAIAAGLALL